MLLRSILAIRKCRRTASLTLNIMAISTGSNPVVCSEIFCRNRWIRRIFPENCSSSSFGKYSFTGVKMNRTDWDRYYSSPMPTALWSRTIVRNHLLRLLRKTGLQENCTIAELGGGGSCFCGKIRKIFKPRDYTVFDSCQSGLEHFLRKNKNCKWLNKGSPTTSLC